MASGEKLGAGMQLIGGYAQLTGGNQIDRRAEGNQIEETRKLETNGMRRMRLLEIAWRKRADITEAYGEAYVVQQLGPRPDECAEEAMTNVMIAGGNPDVYDELMLTTMTSKACAGRADGGGDANDERERGGIWGSSETTAGDSGAGATGSSAGGGRGHGARRRRPQRAGLGGGRVDNPAEIGGGDGGAAS